MEPIDEQILRYIAEPLYVENLGQLRFAHGGKLDLTDERPLPWDSMLYEFNSDAQPVFFHFFMLN